MYNRYSPGPGGQYQRRKIPQPERRPQEQKQHPQPPEHVPAPPCSPPHNSPPAPACQEAPKFFGSSHLRLPLLDKLLPGADNGDLLLLLILLLLMADGNEDSHSVMLTIAIFLFLP